MANTDKHIVLACDPDEGVWAVVLQTDDAAKAVQFWQDNIDDPSLRIRIFTGDFINFSTEEATDG